MTTGTLNTSMTRLESIKGKKNLYNRSKIAEAEALASEALRMANEARLAAARLAEVKRTLALFSSKLESAEASVIKEGIKVNTVPVVVKEVKTIPAVVEEDKTIPLVVKQVKTISVIVKQVSEGLGSEESVEVVESQVVEEPAKEEPVEAAKEEVSDVPVEAAKEEVSDVPVEAAKEEVLEEPVEVEELAAVEEKVEEPVVEELVKENTIEEVSVVEEPAEEPAKVEYKEDPPQETYAVVSKNLINNDVVKVVETQKPEPVVVEAKKPEPVVVEAKKPKEPELVVVEAKEPEPVVVEAKKPEPVVVEAKKPEPLPLSPGVNQHRVAFKPAEVALVAPLQTQENDIIEDFLDALGLDKACGVDDEALGFTDRPVKVKPVEVFVNPTRVHYRSPLENDVFLDSPSFKEQVATSQIQARRFPSKNTQLGALNQDFVDPFGADHDDLVFCGKLADLCEAPAYHDDRYIVAPEYR